MKNCIIRLCGLAATFAPSVAMAQEGGDGGGEKSAVVGYLVVALCVALGIAAVCHPCRRKKY